MEKLKKIFANPRIALREEFDDWAILFDPDTGKTYGLSPVSVFIYKRLDGKHSAQDILSEVRRDCDGVATEAEEHLRAFIDSLVDNGLAGYAQ